MPELKGAQGQVAQMSQANWDSQGVTAWVRVSSLKHELIAGDPPEQP